MREPLCPYFVQVDLMDKITDHLKVHKDWDQTVRFSCAGDLKHRFEL